ncbi:SGNH/GDSL hydrolase family protein [Methylobacterium sp. J-092]|uniref:SGNH/GDSL hydrolase family protein n=1 Tax=Methylobacterium sp. J-092 TaxID=2836667 RepID=UPI001FB8EB84|nr:SGNH/GDSL hydrolase family protein [Methylobacterium sp. J-092]MCJ2009815.1 SGNH/GDSL hydrolase family protein [Methylobacterium sp. J-092]
MSRQPRRLARLGAASDLPNMAAILAYVGPSGEVISDNTNLRLQDGSTPGGLVIARAGINSDITALKGPSTAPGIDILASETAIASAATVDLGTATSLKVLINGTTTITSFGPLAHGFRIIRFAAALTLTHNATSLILQTGANIITAPGDTCIATSDASGNWRVRVYQRADGTALVGVVPTRQVLATGLATGGGDLSVDRTITVPKATAADLNAATDDTKALTSLIVAAALALKAPLASPTFTGSPKAPTPAATDNSTLLATTAFVTNAVATGTVAAILYDRAQSLTAAQAVQAQANLALDAAEVDAASAATTDIGTTTAQFVRVTGTTTVTSFGTAAKRIRSIRFASALTLVHDPAKLILPGALNLLTAPGDTCIASSDASGVWRVRSYQRAADVTLSAPYLGQVANHCRVPSFFVNSNTQMGGRRRFYARDHITQLQTLWPNFYVDGATLQEKGPGAAATIFALLEYPTGVFKRFRFSTSPVAGTGGMDGGIIPDGGMLMSDPLQCRIPMGAEGGVWYYYQNSAGIVYFTDFAATDISHGDTFQFGNNVPNYALGTNSGQAYTNSGDGGTGYGPVAILAPTRKASVCLVGDSRSVGVGDSYLDASHDLGYYERSLSALGVGLIASGKSGDKASAYIASHAQRALLAQYASHVLIEYGRNDIASGDSATTVQNRLTTIAGYFPGKTIIGATLDPDSTYSNGTQTAASFNAQRVALNTAIRAGLPGFSGYVDGGAQLEAGANTGLWKGGTDDYIHANFTGCTFVRDTEVFQQSMFSRGPASVLVA